MPWWPLIAVVGGFCSFIPSVGSLIPLSLVGLAMLIGNRDWTYVAIAFGVWLAVQVLEGFVWQPLLLSKPLGLRTLPVFLALLAGSLLLRASRLRSGCARFGCSNVFWRYFRGLDSRSPLNKDRS